MTDTRRDQEYLCADGNEPTGEHVYLLIPDGRIIPARFQRGREVVWTHGHQPTVYEGLWIERATGWWLRWYRGEWHVALRDGGTRGMMTLVVEYTGVIPYSSRGEAERARGESNAAYHARIVRDVAAASGVVAEANSLQEGGVA